VGDGVSIEPCKEETDNLRRLILKVYNTAVVSIRRKFLVEVPGTFKELCMDDELFARTANENSDCISFKGTIDRN
jgi:hypothetical protein